MEKIKEPECGRGVSIVKGEEIFIGELDGHLFNGKKWSEIRSESIYIPAKESYSPLAAYIIDQCKAANCEDDVDRFKVKLDSLIP